MVGTAIALGVAGAALGAYGGYLSTKEEVRQQENDRKILDAQWRETQNAALAKAQDTRDAASAGFASGTNELARQGAQANRSVAREYEKLNAAAGGAAAAAGMSGVKNSGSSALARATAVGNAREDISLAAADIQAGTRNSMAGLQVERGMAMDQAARIQKSYSEGGDAWNVYQTQGNIITENIDTANSGMAMSILTGGIQGAASGLSMANSLAGIGAFNLPAKSITPGNYSAYAPPLLSAQTPRPVYYGPANLR